MHDVTALCSFSRDVFVTSFSASRPTSPAVVVSEFGSDVQPRAPPRASPLQASPRTDTLSRPDRSTNSGRSHVTSVERALEELMIDPQPTANRTLPSPITTRPPPVRSARPFLEEPIHQSSPKLVHASPYHKAPPARQMTSQSTSTSVGDDNVFVSPGNQGVPVLSNLRAPLFVACF